MFCKVRGLNLNFLTYNIYYHFYINAQILGQTCVKSRKWPFWVQKITKVFLISKKAKNVKVGFFLLISYIRNTGKNMKIEKIIYFHTLKTVVIFGYFFAIFDSFRQNVRKKYFSMFLTHFFPKPPKQYIILDL